MLYSGTWRRTAVPQAGSAPHPVRHYYTAILDRLDKLIDDPYRSLTGHVRNAGGYDKTPTAFAEFVWTDFFRRTIPIEDLRANFRAALRRALPGYKTKYQRSRLADAR